MADKKSLHQLRMKDADRLSPQDSSRRITEFSARCERLRGPGEGGHRAAGERHRGGQGRGQRRADQDQQVREAHPAVLRRLFVLFLVCSDRLHGLHRHQEHPAALQHHPEEQQQHQGRPELHQLRQRGIEEVTPPLIGPCLRDHLR